MSRQETALSGNIADSAITWYLVTGNGGVNVAAVLTSGSATIAPKKLVGASAQPLYNLEGEAYSFTDDFDLSLNLREGDVFGVGVSGASSPVGTVLLTGRFVAWEGW